LIYKISSTCFGLYFAHHQERETEIFTAYGILKRWIYRKLCSFVCKIIVASSWFIYITLPNWWCTVKQK